MAGEWHDINDPGFLSGKKTREAENTEPVAAMEEDQPAREDKPEAEVRLISAEWKPGPKGFQYNEQCFLDVKTEYLKKTIRARIRGNLWGTLNGEEFDLSQEVVGFIDKKADIARMEIKRLWFIDDHYPEWKKDPQTPCAYTIKGIFHSRGANEIDSPVLEMPAGNELLVDFVEIPDITFHTNSAVPVIDEDGSVIRSIVTALLFAKDNLSKETVVFGHTDTDGQVGFNHTLSNYRAVAVKALLDDDVESWKDAVGRYSKTEDYQQTLNPSSTV